MRDDRIIADLNRVLSSLSEALPVPPDAGLEAAVAILRRARWIDPDGGALRLTGTAGWTVGLDLGGTKLHGAISGPGGDLQREILRPTEAAAFDQVVALCRELADAAGVPLAAVSQVALGVPGAVGPDGQVHLAPNISLGPHANLALALSAALGRKVTVWNDCNLAALGEFSGEAGQGGSLAFIALGTGIGMGLILNGQVVLGQSGAAGEIGFLPFGADPFARAAAHPEGGYEAVVGSRALRAAYPAGTVKEIFDLAYQGDPKAGALVAELTANLAIGVAATIALVDPGLVVIGGGIGARPGFAASVAEQVRRLVPAACTIRASRLGDRAGLIGALHMARDCALRELPGLSGPNAIRGAA